ncbi:TadE/TadG family type IV pilus assembly protein [Kineococcus rhizosphaerae]|uniref:Flp pilus assembly protein TadG n=1 Tax=Kineococcus rhizosphaerae TaxID=559628 RepID=A0A2T0QWQ4_9ACTN|nr:TadE/TadG family type IV pilus assembly protein [Kineococcus rhizosphaerae]PRY09900.1 Flp pilus assembly protein TadG [Kineococcus rhizosphaerae]
MPTPQKNPQPTSGQLLNGSTGAEKLARRHPSARTCCGLRLPGALRRRLRGGAGGSAEEGSMAVEMAVLAPAIGLLIGFVIAAGRLSVSQGIVQAAAVDSARMASISRTATAAQAAARSGAEASLQGQPNTCSSYTVQANTAGFAQRVGVPAQVEVTVECTVPLADLIPGLPGSKTITKTAISPLDTYRERTQ